MNEKEVKREWEKCASFIRKTYSFAYPSYFDSHFEEDMDRHLKNGLPLRGYSILIHKFRQDKRKNEAVSNDND